MTALPLACARHCTTRPPLLTPATAPFILLVAGDPSPAEAALSAFYGGEDALAGFNVVQGEACRLHLTAQLAVLADVECDMPPIRLGVTDLRSLTVAFKILASDITVTREVVGHWVEVPGWEMMLYVTKRWEGIAGFASAHKVSA